MLIKGKALKQRLADAALSRYLILIAAFASGGATFAAMEVAEVWFRVVLCVGAGYFALVAVGLTWAQWKHVDRPHVTGVDGAERQSDAEPTQTVGMPDSRLGQGA